MGVWELGWGGRGGGVRQKGVRGEGWEREGAETAPSRSTHRRRVRLPSCRHRRSLTPRARPPTLVGRKREPLQLLLLLLLHRRRRAAAQLLPLHPPRPLQRPPRRRERLLQKPPMLLLLLLPPPPPPARSAVPARPAQSRGRAAPASPRRQLLLRPLQRATWHLGLERLTGECGVGAEAGVRHRKQQSKCSSSGAQPLLLRLGALLAA